VIRETALKIPQKAYHTAGVLIEEINGALKLSTIATVAFVWAAAENSPQSPVTVAPRPVSLIKEDPLPRIAACANVIDRVLKLYPQRPRHAPALPIQPTNVKCLDLTRFHPSSISLARK
jgi:hypothetical protein